MSVQDQFTAEELARLVAGETVSKSLKGGSTTPADKNEDKVEEAEEYKPESFTPRSSIAINSGGKVTKPQVKDHSGAATSPGNEKISGWSGGASSRWDDLEAEKAQAREEAKRLAEEEERIQAELSPAQILNKFNATQRVVEKLQREVNSLKKQLSEKDS